MSILTLEIRGQADKTAVGNGIVLTPPIGEGYWSYRVCLSDKQAIVGFPKFFTVGIGFAVEADDWNVNLPYTSSAEEIYEHIVCNKGDDSITREDCVTAIEMIQQAVKGAIA